MDQVVGFWTHSEAPGGKQTSFLLWCFVRQQWRVDDEGILADTDLIMEVSLL